MGASASLAKQLDFGRIELQCSSNWLKNESALELWWQLVSFCETPAFFWAALIFLSNGRLIHGIFHVVWHFLQLFPQTHLRIYCHQCLQRSIFFWFYRIGVWHFLLVHCWFTRSCSALKLRSLNLSFSSISSTSIKFLVNSRLAFCTSWILSSIWSCIRFSSSSSSFISKRSGSDVEFSSYSSFFSYFVSSTNRMCSSRGLNG